MLKKFSPYLLSIALLILGLSVGFAIGKNLSVPTSNTQGPINQVPLQSEANNGLYSSQTASIRGEVVKRDANVLTIKNLNSNVTGEVRISSGVTISKVSTKPGDASPSSNLSDIQLNKEALMALESRDGVYEVVSIIYVLPTPTLPPLAKPAAN